jgi:magnesium chelatase subunit I
VNLLEDHLVDLLLDVAASGENVVEREGLSVRHPARFVLIGSGNPEEGELRPQLLDRFGLSVEVRTPDDLADPHRGRAPARRVRARPGGLRARVAARGGRLRRHRSPRARASTGDRVPDEALERAARCASPSAPTACAAS